MGIILTERIRVCEGSYSRAAPGLITGRRTPGVQAGAPSHAPAPGKKHAFNWKCYAVGKVDGQDAQCKEGEEVLYQEPKARDQEIYQKKKEDKTVYGLSQLLLVLNLNQTPWKKTK